MTALDVSGWDVSGVTTLQYTFYGCSSLTLTGIRLWTPVLVTNAAYCLNGVTLSRYEYDQLLLNWSALSLQSGVPFHAGSSKYTAGGSAAAAHDVLTNAPNLWTITDGGTGAQQAYAPLSTASVPATGTVGVAVDMTVQAKDTAGDNMAAGGATVVIGVTGANTATPTVTDVTDGTYTASYTPLSAGGDSAAITLGGVAISGSPYGITVTDPPASGGKRNLLLLGCG